MYFIFSGRFTQMFSYDLEYNSYLTHSELHHISRICSCKKFYCDLYQNSDEDWVCNVDITELNPEAGIRHVRYLLN